MANSTKSADEFQRGLFMTAANFVIVIIGLIIGQLLLCVCSPPPTFINTFRVAIWNNNGTSLPIVLVTAIAHFAPQLSSADGGPEEAQARAIGFVAFYALSYQTLAWTVGWHMLRPPSSFVELEEETAAEAASKKEDDVPQLPSLSPSLELSIVVAKPPASTPLGSGNKNKNNAHSQVSQNEPAQRQRQRALLDSIVSTVQRSFIWRKILVPPVIGVFLGIFVGMVAPLRRLLCEEGGGLQFAFVAITSIGAIAPALSMTILGINLANGPKGKKAGGWKVLFFIMLGKLVLLPLCVFLLLAGLKPYLPDDPVLLMVIMVESMTPSANNMVMMCQLHGHGAEEAASILFWQYLLGIPPMAMWIVLFLAYVL